MKMIKAINMRRLVSMAMTTALIVSLCAAPAYAQASPESAAAVPEPAKKAEKANKVAAKPKGTAGYVSGWIKASNSQNTVLRFIHGLPAAPTSVAVWFSPDEKGAVSYPILGYWSSAQTGNPVTIRVDQEAVELHIFGGAPLHGVWDAKTEKWTMYADGYFRVVAR
jgi:hypothetical protein